MDCSLPGSSVHGISQARILEWVVISFSRGSSWSRNRTWVSCLAGRFFIAEPPRKPQTMGNLMWISLVLNHLEARLTNHVQAEALWIQFYVQFSSVAQSCPTLCKASCQASLSITNSRSSLRLTSIESVMPSSHFILCHPLLLLPPIPPSIRVFIFFTLSNWYFSWAKSLSQQNWHFKSDRFLCCGFSVLWKFKQYP